MSALIEPISFLAALCNSALIFFSQHLSNPLSSVFCRLCGKPRLDFLRNRMSSMSLNNSYGTKLVITSNEITFRGNLSINFSFRHQKNLRCHLTKLLRLKILENQQIAPSAIYQLFSTSLCHKIVTDKIMSEQHLNLQYLAQTVFLKFCILNSYLFIIRK